MSSGLYTCSTNSHGSGHSHPHNLLWLSVSFLLPPTRQMPPPHIANLEEVFIRDYPITSGKDGRRERPLTGMVSRLLTEGSLLLHQQKEQFEVLHLKITLGCFTRAWSKKGGMKFLAENMSVSLGSGNILSSLCVCSTASFLRLKPWL